MSVKVARPYGIGLFRPNGFEIRRGQGLSDDIGRDGGGRLSLEDWARLLEDRFFPRSNRGRPVYLAVDDDVLDELAGGQGEGVVSLLRAVRPQLRLHDPADLFE